MCFESTAFLVFDKTSMINYRLNAHAGKFDLSNDMEHFEGQYKVKGKSLYGSLNMNGRQIEFFAIVDDFENFELMVELDSKQHNVLVKIQKRQMGNHDF